MKGSQELPISLTTKTYDKALMSVSGRSWECAKESTSESGHVLNPGVCETGEGHGRVEVRGGDPMAKAWGQGSDGSFSGLLDLAGSCPPCAAHAGGITSCPWAGMDGCCGAGAQDAQQ